jgi:FAD/FMN-containing dehydrogenase
MPQIALQFTMKHLGITNPVATASPWYVLTELADANPAILETILENAMEQGLVTDASIAQSETQRAAFWAVREGVPESQRFEGGSIKHDISVPVSHMPAFIDEATKALNNFMPDARLVCFGHLGDGNLHFNLTQPIGMDKQNYLDQWQYINEVVFAVVLKHGGSISAEHGIGQLKRANMLNIKSKVELDMMRGIKALLDPKAIMNPGKLLP